MKRLSARLAMLVLVVRRLVRRPLRTGLTVGGIALAMFLFTMIDAMRVGVREATEPGPEDRTLVVYRENRWCPFTSRLPQWYVDRISNIEGVVSAVPMAIRVSNCRASLDVVTFRGVPVDDFIARPPKGFSMLAGETERFRSRGDAALVGEPLAARRGLRVGDRFEAAGISVVVAGIFESDEPQDRNAAYVPLAFLQESASRGSTGGEVTQFNVVVDSSERLEQVAAAIDALFEHETHPTSTRPERAFVARAARDIVAMVGFASLLGWASLAAVFGLVANAMVLAMQDRVRDHAVMQTLGFTRGLLAILAACEGLLLGLLGGTLGAGLAAIVLLAGRFSIAVEGSNLELATDLGIAAVGIGFAVLVGVLAGLVPGLQSARREIVASLRAS